MEGRALLAGGVNLRRLELIGPRILVRRKLDRSFQLGFGDPEQRAARAATRERCRRRQVENAPNAIDVLMTADDPAAARPAWRSRPSISAGRSCSVLWQRQIALVSAVRLPTDLISRRADYGFVLFTDARISSGAEPWRTEVVTTYRSESKTFNVGARIFDLVPADIADEVFALSQLAQVKLPLSGRPEIEFAEAENSSRLGRAVGPAGRVGFELPGRSVLIDEGLIGSTTIPLPAGS